MSYGKIYPSMYTGSLVGAGPVVFALMPYIIANARPDDGSMIDINPALLAATFGCSTEEVGRAVEFLCMPDNQSRTPACDGCRLVKRGPMSYFVVNLEKYRFEEDRDKRREYWREYKRKQRVSTPVHMESNGHSTMSSHADADADADADAVQTPPNPPKGGKSGGYHPDSRVALHYLNEKAGVHFREVDSNLTIISQRLKEPEVTIAGVREMIDHQVLEWKNTEREKYLRPETLFAKSKFDGYYARRLSEIVPQTNGYAPRKKYVPNI